VKGSAGCAAFISMVVLMETTAVLLPANYTCANLKIGIPLLFEPWRAKAFPILKRFGG